MKVKEIGNLTADPVYGEKEDLKYCNFTIAINNPFREDDTEFVKVSVFGKQAENCRDYLQTGSQICVEGRVKPKGLNKLTREIISALVNHISIGDNREIAINFKFNKEIKNICSF